MLKKWKKKWCFADIAFNKSVEMRRNLFNAVGLNVKLLFSILRVSTLSTCPLSLDLGKKMPQWHVSNKFDCSQVISVTKIKFKYLSISDICFLCSQHSFVLTFALINLERGIF